MDDSACNLTLENNYPKAMKTSYTCPAFYFANSYELNWLAIS